MIYTVSEYCEKFLCGNKSAMTVKRMIISKILPHNHKARKLPGKTGPYVIEVPDDTSVSVKAVIQGRDIVIAARRYATND